MRSKFVEYCHETGTNDEQGVRLRLVTVVGMLHRKV